MGLMVGPEGLGVKSLGQKNLREVQELLGHSSPETTSLYTKIRDSHLREAVDRLDFAGPPQPAG